VDPIAAPVVQRIFDEYCAGSGLQTIALRLNADGILSPSGHDPARNSHRATGHGRWAKSAVRAILANPRYTGFEVWNKQRKDEVLVDVDDVALGHQTKMRWNDRSEWIWSPELMHEPLVTREQFEAAQDLFGTRKHHPPHVPAEGRHYLLSGLMHCNICGRRMQGQWTRGKAYYRCKYPEDYPQPEGGHPRSVYVRESAVTPGLDEWLAQLFDDDHIDHTCSTLAGVSEPDPETLDHEQRQRAGIAACDHRIAKYHQLLDNDVDPALVAAWITEAQRERRGIEAELSHEMPGKQLSVSQVKALVHALRDIVATLAAADPADKADLYRELGVSLRYDPSGAVTVQAQPRGVKVRVGGGT
jgi:site-specific DNA recombinase